MVLHTWAAIFKSDSYTRSCNGHGESDWIGGAARSCMKIDILLYFVFCARTTRAASRLTAYTPPSRTMRVQPKLFSHVIALSSRTNAHFSHCPPTSARVSASSAPDHARRSPHSAARTPSLSGLTSSSLRQTRR